MTPILAGGLWLADPCCRSSVPGHVLLLVLHYPPQPGAQSSLKLMFLWNWGLTRGASLSAWLPRDVEGLPSSTCSC